ncbi:MAG: UDP-N-acetylmuramoyl-L-alanine--D-glutamate ligase [Bacillota bacterium]|jgi:UDP-N-acetylmuramoylalanine--D-glutamate ligase
MLTERQQAVLSSLQGKRAAVIGIGLRSGVPLIRFLLQAGCRVVACDRKPREELTDVLTALQGLPIEYQLGADYLADLQRCQLLFRTPGMRPDVPALLAAAAAGSQVTSEIELVFSLAAAPITGITGSQGKTTTTALIAEILRADGRRVHLGGNIGRSLVEEVLGIGETAEIVLELSSFQLLGMRESPHTALVTNLSPNHLDYHRSMEEYISAKANILKHQTDDALLVLNGDNYLTRQLAASAPGRIVWFSRQETVSQGACLQGDQIVLVEAGRVMPVCGVQELVLPGWHNVENVLAAAAVAWARGASLASIRQAVTTFVGVEHRLEFVRELSGVKYYNDSKATSPASTVAALNALPGSVVLVAGGYDKKIPFQSLAEAMQGKVRALALIGETADKIAQAVSSLDHNALAVRKFKSMEEAVLWCRQQAQPGESVLLSPACASFDMYKDFEQRGRVFKRLVSELK